MRRVGLCAALLAVTGAVHAHVSFTSYLTVEADRGERRARLTWDLPVRDVHDRVDLDVDADGRITWGEIDARRGDIERLMTRHLTVLRSDAPCEAALDSVQLRHIGDVPHVALSFTADCARNGELEIGAMLPGRDGSQATLLEVRSPKGTFSAVLSSDQPRWRQSEAVKD